MRRQYELTVRQEPKQARMCGIGGKADRRPIDPPVIVQLRVIDPAVPPTSSVSATSTLGPNASSSTSPDGAGASGNDVVSEEEPYANLPGYAQSFLQNPYYFMFASLAKPDDDTELHWLKDGRTRCTTGSVVSSLYALKDPTAPGAGKDTKEKDGPTTGGCLLFGEREGSSASDAGFFVFPDLSVRTEGSYRLKLSLFEVVGNDVRHCKSIYSAPFYVYTAKKFPGVEESSPLTCSLADQGIKIRIRKDIRMRKGRGGMGVGPHRPLKRSRTDDGTGSNNTGGAPPVGTAWPSTPLIPPPPGAEIQGPQGQVAIQGAPSAGMQGQQAPVPPQDIGYDARAGPYAPYDANGHHQQQPHPAHPQQQQHNIPPPPPPGYRADAMPPPPPPPHPGYAPPHPQYQHPYYAHAYPPPWAGAYTDPYAAHPHHHQHQQYAPPPPMRYDYGYPPPPPHYPYYEQPQPQQQGYAEYAQGYAHGGPPLQGQAQAQQQQQGNTGAQVPAGGMAANAGAGMGSTPSVPSMAPNPSVPSMGPAPGIGNANMAPNPVPNMQTPVLPQNPNMPNMAPNPNARPPPPPQQYYRPYVQPPPYYGYAQPQPQPPQPQHEAHAWGTPPSGFPPPPQVWGDYAAQAQQPHVQQPHAQQPHAQPVAGGNGGGQVPPVPGQGQVHVHAHPQGQQGQGQGQVGALRSPNARIELAPLRPREEEGAGVDPGAGRSPPGAQHPIIQLRSGSAAGGGPGRISGNREAGKKNPLSIGSIISDETH
ncbi:velvet factor-domain-containing protein [Mycena maculata]|uniref:Velvet factor-domain-containing protein n=1 Tax=Mycena maculata TaxID=230809 RepID=A0AAD7NP55_9AGAR|nr:velvet factor-domain-containing protein [Mycena maculata]